MLGFAGAATETNEKTSGPRPELQHGQCHSSKSQIVQIVVTDLNVVKSRFRIVVLDEIMLDAGFAVMSEKIFPVDGAFADVREMSQEFDRAGCPAVAAGTVGIVHVILHMDKREAAGIFIEICDWIFSRNGDPAEIHFHGDELGIRLCEKKIVREFSAESFGRLEFERVVVIAKLNASFLAFLAGFVKKLGGAFPSAGLSALLLVNPRTNDVAVADDFGGLESFRPLVFDSGIVDVGGRRGEAVLVEKRANVFRRMLEIAGELDFLVAGRGDFGDGA